MAAFTLTQNENIDNLSGKTGGDTYTTAGFTLTIDQDSRVGLNQSTSASLGAITISAATGGKVVIDARKVRLIPYNSGSGNVPAWNTTISQGSASGKLIGVYSSLTAASTATGAAMPASGYLKIKAWNDVAFTSGALTGISASATGADTVGWLEIVGDEAATVNANRLGSFETYGMWLQIGTTSGSSNQTMQIPNGGLLRYCAGVYIEQTAGQGDYEFYPNAGTTTTTGTEAARGKVVWIDNAGLVRIGNSGAATNGYTPGSGRAVVVPSIFLENCTTATRTANVIPSATLGTRYDFTCTGGGVVSMDKTNCAWYGSFIQAYSVALTNSGFVDAITLQECATAIVWSKVGVGNKPTTALVTQPLTMTLCFAGGTLTDCVFAMVSQGVSGNHISTITDISGFTFNNCTLRANTIRGNVTTYAINGTRLSSCTFTNLTVIQGEVYLATCTDITISGQTYVDCVSGTTVTTYAKYIWVTTGGSKNINISGLSLPVTNAHPYTALLLVSSGSNNVKFRNVGSRASPLSLGSANACGLIFLFGTGVAASDVKIQRVYCVNTRTGIMTGDNSTKRVTLENVFGDYADAADVGAVLEYKRKGIGGTLALTAQISVYGTHWVDYFTGTTAGRIAIVMNEPTAATAGQVSLANGAAFTSAGGLYMPTIGQTATFETPEYILGHTGFQNSALVMAGGTATNYTYEFAIDKNDGNGFSAMTSSAYTATTLGTALSGITGIDASKGFKLKLKIATGTVNTTAITSVYVLTNSSTTAQDYQYPLDTGTVQVQGLVTGSRIVARKVADQSLVYEGAESGGVAQFVTDYLGAIAIEARKASSTPYYKPWSTQITPVDGTTTVATALQESDE